MLSQEPNNVWNVNKKGNMEVEMESEFEKYFLSVSEMTSLDIDEISVFRFNAFVEKIKENSHNKKT